MHVIYKCLCNYIQGTCTQLVIIDNHTSQLFTQLFKKLKLQDTIWVLVKTKHSENSMCTQTRFYN